MLRCLGHSLEIKDEAHKSESNCIDLYNELNTTLIYIYIYISQIYVIIYMHYAWLASLLLFL